MSKLIVDMEMPKNMCSDCEISIDGFACKKSRMDGGKCPIVGVLPEEHGDLIDRDEVKKEILKRMPRCCMSGSSDREGIVCTRRMMLYPISHAKVIIAAERKDDEQIHKD